MKDITNNIDLHYIGADKAREFINRDLYDLLIDLVCEDLGRIEGYISKYDNKWDRMEGTSVEDLKEARDIIRAKLDRVRELDRTINHGR